MNDNKGCHNCRHATLGLTYYYCDWNGTSDKSYHKPDDYCNNWSERTEIKEESTNTLISNSIVLKPWKEIQKMILEHLDKPSYMGLTPQTATEDELDAIAQGLGIIRKKADEETS